MSERECDKENWIMRASMKICWWIKWKQTNWDVMKALSFQIAKTWN